MTWLLVLVIGSMLVATGFAERAAMNMPCCSEHRSTNCHAIRATPTGNTNSATVPQFLSEIQAFATLYPALSVPHLAARQIQPSLAPSSEDLLKPHSRSAHLVFSPWYTGFGRRASTAVSCRSQGTLGRWKAEVPELKSRGFKALSTFRKHLIVAAIATLTLFFGSAREVRAGVVEASRPANCRNLPVIKNRTGLKGQHVCDGMSVSRELTKGEVKKLEATATSAEDHLTVARFYRAEGNGLDAQAARYEDAAANLWEGPVVKNLTSPTTAGRFVFAAKGFRDEAKADRAVAASHAEMAKTVVASLN